MRPSSPYSLPGEKFGEAGLPAPMSSAASSVRKGASSRTVRRAPIKRRESQNASGLGTLKPERSKV
jgi:hypothetical protein